MFLFLSADENSNIYRRCISFTIIIIIIIIIIISIPCRLRQDVRPGL